MSYPLITLAEQAGRRSVRIGLLGWAVLAAGGALLFAGRVVAAEDRFGVVAGCGIAVLVAGAATAVGGLMVAANGHTKLMHDTPDPGAKWVYGGMAVNAVPMVLVAAVAVGLPYLKG